MNLSELRIIRNKRQRPAIPIVITDLKDVHTFCLMNDLPVLWIPQIDQSESLTPLHGLDVWLIANNRTLSRELESIKPKSLWSTGFYAYADKVNSILGRKAL